MNGQAGGWRRAIYVTNGEIAAHACIFSNNAAVGPAGTPQDSAYYSGGGGGGAGLGGALYVANGAGTLTDCVLVSNSIIGAPAAMAHRAGRRMQGMAAGRPAARRHPQPSGRIRRRRIQRRRRRQKPQWHCHKRRQRRVRRRRAAARAHIILPVPADWRRLCRQRRGLLFVRRGGGGGGGAGLGGWFLFKMANSHATTLHLPTTPPWAAAAHLLWFSQRRQRPGHGRGNPAASRHGGPAIDRLPITIPTRPTS